jgi:hypothetical protein
LRRDLRGGALVDNLLRRVSLRRQLFSALKLLGRERELTVALREQCDGLVELALGLARSGLGALSWASSSAVSMRASVCPSVTLSPSLTSTCFKRPASFVATSTRSASMRPLALAMPGGRLGTENLRQAK